MGETTEIGMTLFMDVGDGFQPVGELREIDTGKEAVDGSSLTFTGSLPVTMTFRLTLRCRIKLWWLKIKAALKQRFCQHHWTMVNMVSGHNFEEGVRTSVWWCYCPRCGKWEQRKYSS